MGCYINPEGMTKDFWLYRRQEGTLEAPVWDDMPEGMLPVCLVQNAEFSAAAVAYTESERDSFAHEDGRPKRWFLISIEALKTVSNVENYLKKSA